MCQRGRGITGVTYPSTVLGATHPSSVSLRKRTQPCPRCQLSPELWPCPRLPPRPQNGNAVDLAAFLPLQITFEISKQEDSQIPLWIIVGSTLGGLLLLALLVLALWKVRAPPGGGGCSILLGSPGLRLQPLGSGASPHVLLPMGAGSLLPRTCRQAQHPALTTAGCLATRGHQPMAQTLLQVSLRNLMKTRVPLIRKKASTHSHKMFQQSQAFNKNSPKIFTVSKPQVKMLWCQLPPVIDEVREAQRGVLTGAESHSMTSCRLTQAPFTQF